ncbi:MAG TPA: hypothetical protein ACQGQH_07790 [Xylella sp.]
MVALHTSLSPVASCFWSWFLEVLVAAGIMLFLRQDVVVRWGQPLVFGELV